MKTISIETTTKVHHFSIGEGELQARTLQKGPSEVDRKQDYENHLNEGGAQMTEREETIYYGRSCVSFIDVSLHVATNVEIQITKEKSKIHIRLMLLESPYGPISILDDIFHDMEDQDVVRAGIADLLGTIAPIHMKDILDKMDADLTTTLRLADAEFIFHPDRLTVKDHSDCQTTVYERNKLYSHSTTFAPKGDGSCDRVISLCIFPPSNSVALKSVDIFHGTFDTMEDPPGFIELLRAIVNYLPGNRETDSEETSSQESRESSCSSTV